MPTPHMSAAEGDFAATVLMPGDPKRAAHIANDFLDGARAVTDVRAMVGYTGSWKGTPVSVMPSGMGMPSAAIYITELIRFYGVQRLVRVGTSGAYLPDVELRDIVAAERAVTNSSLPSELGAPAELLAAPVLLEAAKSTAAAAGIELKVGTILSSDIFYEPDDRSRERAEREGILAVEMEAAALYAIAALEGVEALTLVTVTDHIVSGQHLSAEDRQTGVDEMIRLALDTVC